MHWQAMRAYATHILSVVYFIVKQLGYILDLDPTFLSLHNVTSLSVDA